MDFDQHLNTLYFEEKRMFGRDRLYKHVQRHRPDLVQAGLSRRYVMQWLRRQEIHQLFHPVCNKKEVQSTVPHEPFAIVALDLIDMASLEHRGFKWALTGIDLFSKKGYAVALKSKSAADVMRGLALLLHGNTVAFRVQTHGSQNMAQWTVHRVNAAAPPPRVVEPQMRRHPRHLRSDNGVELKNALLTKFLQQHTSPVRADGAAAHTTQHYSTPGLPQSNGCIERFNKSLKEKIRMMAVQDDDSDWVAMLPIILRNWNECWSRVTNSTPNDIEEQFLAGQSVQDVRQTIVASVRGYGRRPRARRCQESPATPKFAVGDQVRVRLHWDKSAGLNWSREVYTIVSVAKQQHQQQQQLQQQQQQQQLHRHVQYKLKNSKAESVPGVFYHDNLQRYTPVARAVEGPERFVIDRLVKPVLRTRQNQRERMYEVKWAGYRQHTEEPRSTLLLDVAHLVRRFETQHAVAWHADQQPTWTS
jgi:hypothetical protein